MMMSGGVPIVSAADLWARDQEERRQPLIRRETRMQGRRISFQEELMHASARMTEDNPARLLKLR